jgi:hypothetical protein
MISFDELTKFVKNSGNNLRSFSIVVDHTSMNEFDNYDKP